MAAAITTSARRGRVLGSGRLFSVERPDSSSLNNECKLQLLLIDNSNYCSLLYKVENSLRLLAPTQKKLTSIESQRVMTVATETHKRMEKALALPYLVEEIDRYSVSLGDEIVQLVLQYQSLSEQYLSLYNVLDADNKDPIQLIHDDDDDTSQLEPLHLTNVQLFVKTRSQLQNATKSLLRHLNQLPVTETILQQFRLSQQRRTEMLLSSIAKLNEVQNDKLLTTSSDQKLRRNHIDTTRQRELETEGIILQLERDLTECQHIRDKEVRDSNGRTGGGIEDPMCMGGQYHY